MDKSFNLKVQTDEASLSKTNGQFTIEPLSRISPLIAGFVFLKISFSFVGYPCKYAPNPTGYW